MARVISCHHFRGQRVGRCDEAVDVAVSGHTVIVALEHQINIYGKTDECYSPVFVSLDSDRHEGSPPPVLPGPAAATTTAKLMSAAAASTSKPPSPLPALPHLCNHDLGTSFVFLKSFKGISSNSPKTKLDSSSPPTKRIESIESDTELRLSHSFSTIDLIHKISYNEKGKYILCLEKREASTSSITNVRSYFHWETDHGTKPMRARIAGLVSPTGAEPEEDSLMMVEIPLTSPATAVASCNLTGHIACLSAESIINLFLFRAKEVHGRVRVHYYDFDRTYAIDMPGFVPDKIYFVCNYLACMNSDSVHVFNVKKEELQQGSPHFNSCSSPAIIHEVGRPSNKHINHTDKVIFNPKNETIKVYLPSIARANRKRKYTNINIVEDFQDEIISNHTKVIFSAGNPGIIVEDILRLSSGGGGNHPKFTEIGIYPIRINDLLGAVALMVCTKKEGYLYHLPTKQNCSVVRVASYPFTAPLITFAFDSIFFHALTESGLESYTCRSLYYATKDHEGIKPFLNDCPFHEEPPTLVGIRPFLNVRKMTCNSSILSLLACNNTSNNKNAGQEELSWTIYTLDLPDIGTTCDDMVKTANLQNNRTSDIYITLLCEAFTALKLFMNAHPGSEAHGETVACHSNICKLLGLAYLKSSVSTVNLQPISQSGSSNLAEETINTTVPSTTTPSTLDSSSSSVSELIPDTSPIMPADIINDLVDKGVTYLLIGRCGIGEVFSPENWSWIREACNIPGFIRMIEVTFIKCNEFEIHPDNQKLSPTLAPVVVEFLANCGPQTLVDLVIHAPFIRECNSRRLLHILQQLAEAKNFPAKETLAVILTLVTIGVDLNTRSQINDLLHKTNLSDLETYLKKEILIETRGQQTFLTDLAVCIIASDNQFIISEKLFQYLKANSINMSIVMFAFAQALNVNTDTTLQHCITKCLTGIVEKYTWDKFSSAVDLSHIEFVEDEKRGIQFLVRTYLSNINFSSNIPASTPKTVAVTDQDSTANEKSKSVNTSVSTDIMKRNQIFGNVCTCVNFLLSVNCPGGMLTPQSQNLATVQLFVNEDSRENYIKLLSLISNSILSDTEGVKDIILTYLYKNATQVKPSVNSTLYFILQIFAETPEKAVNMLLTKQPTTIMIFAKETFEGSTSKWKCLVTNLKKRVQNSNATETEIFATILESVYLHLANSMTPLQLEQVLDKETEESHKFHGICTRVELANNYANMVIAVSTDYLNPK